MKQLTWWQKGLVVLCAVVLVVGLCKDLVAKIAIEKGVEAVTGLKLSMKTFRIGIVTTRVRITGMQLLNPNGFPEKVMLDMPEIYVDYSLLPLLRGKIDVPEIRINLKEFNVVKNTDGAVNLDALKVVQQQNEGKTAAKKAAPAQKKEKGPELFIGLMQLKIDTVTLRDYSRGAKPTVSTFNLKLDETYRDITDPAAVVSIIVVKALMNTTIGSILQFDVSGLQDTLGGTLGKAQEVAAQAMRSTQESVGKLAEGTQDTLKETAEDLKGLINKLPFGGGGEQ